MSDEAFEDFRVMAHAGASAYFPPNTIEAFEAAVAQKADMIETDVRLTSDGVLVLHHDACCEQAEIDDLSYVDLKSIHPNIATVSEALDAVGTDLPFCWEIKARGVEMPIWELLSSRPEGYRLQEAQFTSFDLEPLTRMRAIGSHNTLGHLRTKVSLEGLVALSEAEIDQVCLPAANILANPEVLTDAAALGLQVRAWSVGEPAKLPELARLGVFGATVDWPDQARSALKHARSA